MISHTDDIPAGGQLVITFDPAYAGTYSFENIIISAGFYNPVTITSAGSAVTIVLSKAFANIENIQVQISLVNPMAAAAVGLTLSSSYGAFAIATKTNQPALGFTYAARVGPYGASTCYISTFAPSSNNIGSGDNMKIVHNGVFAWSPTAAYIIRSAYAWTYVAPTGMINGVAGIASFTQV